MPLNRTISDFAGVELTLDDFSLLQALCAADPLFPKTWSDWQALLTAATFASTDHGQAPAAAVPINATRFAGWCQKVDLTPCLDALRVYCRIHHEPERHQAYGRTALNSDVAPPDF